MIFEPEVSEKIEVQPKKSTEFCTDPLVIAKLLNKKREVGEKNIFVHSISIRKKSDNSE